MRGARGMAVAGVLVWLLAGCATVEIQQTRVVTGQITNESGKPVAGTPLVVMGRTLDLVTTRIVVQCHDRRSAEALKRVTAGQVTTVVSNDVVGRLAAQACRQKGLSTVYQELFDFSGAEIYFRAVPELVGCSFARAALAFDEVAIFGVRFADGSLELAPDPALVLGPGDELIGFSP